MISRTLAPRPKRSNWMRLIYNILHDNPSTMDAEKIWDLVPSTMHVPHAKKKFLHALSNMVHAGYLKAYSQVGTSKKGYRLADMATYQHCNAKNKEANLAYKKSQRRKAAHRPAQSPKPRAMRPTVNGLQGQIHVELAKVTDQINALMDKRRDLKVMSKMAGKL